MCVQCENENKNVGSWPASVRPMHGHMALSEPQGAAAGIDLGLLSFF